MPVQVFGIVYFGIIFAPLREATGLSYYIYLRIFYSRIHISSGSAKWQRKRQRGAAMQIAISLRIVQSIIIILPSLASRRVFSLQSGAKSFVANYLVNNLVTICLNKYE